MSSSFSLTRLDSIAPFSSWSLLLEKKLKCFLLNTDCFGDDRGECTGEWSRISRISLDSLRLFFMELIMLLFVFIRASRSISILESLKLSSVFFVFSHSKSSLSSLNFLSYSEIIGNFFSRSLCKEFTTPLDLFRSLIIDLTSGVVA